MRAKLPNEVWNGYATNALEMLVEFRGLRRYGKGRNACYTIRPGCVIKI